MTDERMARRSMRTALETLEALHSHKLSASPRNYELWYTYYEGRNAGLNKAVDSILHANGAITNEEIDEICRSHLTPSADVDGIHRVCAGLTSWLYTIVREVADGSSDLNRYTKTLNTAKSELSTIEDPRLGAIIGNLVSATNTVQERNLHLEGRLHEAQAQITEMRETMESVRTEVITDQLTGLSNRRYFDHVLAETMCKSFEAGHDMALILGDVDHFKTFNDTWGHQTGDQVLKLVSGVIRRSTKGRDTAARYGGEEFAIILPETRLRDARTVADGIRNEIMAKRLVRKSSGSDLGRVTISFGITALVKGDTAEDIIERADRALYAAKHAGRNCVRMSTDLEPGGAVKSAA